MCYIFQGETDQLQTRYRNGVRMTHVTDVCSDVNSEVKVVMSYHQSDACVPITRQWKVNRNTKIGRKVVHAMADILHQFEGQKTKRQGHQAA